MYAISHAATALALKRRYPRVPLWPLLLSVQAIELVWVVLTLTGVEHVSVVDAHVALDFLPYSHSVLSTAALAFFAMALLWRSAPKRELAVAVALGVFSHVVLDLVQHQSDIFLLPTGTGPRLGLGLMNAPWLNLAVELAFGAACVWLVGGGRRLLAGVVLFNLANLPTMFQLPQVVAPIIAHPALLPVLILAQIVVTWLFVARFAPKTLAGAPELSTYRMA